MMEKPMTASLMKLSLAGALFSGAVAPSVEAIECVSQYYGSSYCTQCYVDSPYGWVPVGETT